MNELALFAGAGGGILGGRLLGWRTVCAVEWDAHARDVLVARQNDGCLEPFPIWDDVQTFDGRPWRGRVDVVSGGFPCQDISAAGKGAGITGDRSGMWSHMARIIGEVRPRFVFVENSPVLTSRGLGTVLGDLAAMGYDAQWGVLGAIDAGAPHKRERIWIVADNQSGGRGEGGGGDLIQAIRGNQNSHFKSWPTPTVCGNYNRKGASKTSGDGLATAVKQWATPQARDFRTGQQSRWENPERTRNLNDQIGGQLNPTWVEWLMGWPLGWTDCAASGTDKFQLWQRSHGESSTL